MKQVQTVQPTDWMRVQLQASHEGEPLLYKGETKIVDTDDENGEYSDILYTGRILQRLDTNVHSGVTAKMSTAL